MADDNDAVALARVNTTTPSPKPRTSGDLSPFACRE